MYFPNLLPRLYPLRVEYPNFRTAHRTDQLIFAPSCDEDFHSFGDLLASFRNNSGDYPVNRADCRTLVFPLTSRSITDSSFGVPRLPWRALIISRRNGNISEDWNSVAGRGYASYSPGVATIRKTLLSSKAPIIHANALTSIPHTLLQEPGGETTRPPCPLERNQSSPT